MIRIILGGPLRGNHESWRPLAELRSSGAKIYVGSRDPSEWSSFPVDHEIVETSVMSETSFEETQHRHKQRYIEQWSNLYLAYRNFSELFSDDDIVMKLRNDIIFDPWFLPLENEIDDGAVYVPSTEFHNIFGFDESIICNDQVVIGRKTVMDVYFKMPLDFVFKDEEIKKDQQKNGIERLLRLYLYQKNIDVRTFPMNYRKVYDGRKKN
jgi:hypothetical protein